MRCAIHLCVNVNSYIHHTHGGTTGGTLLDIIKGFTELELSTTSMLHTIRHML